MSDVRLILDTSAILAYTSGSLSVGEVIAEVADEPAMFAVPLPCLLEAGRQTATEHLDGLYLLVAHRHGTVLPEPADRWRSTAGLARTLGRVDLAAALLAALDHGAHILTAEPDAYGKPGQQFVIEI